MKTRLLTLRLLPVLAAMFALASQQLHATMVYYMPYDNGANASLANGGSAGGTATAVTGISGATAPSASQAQVVSSLGSTWSENFPVTGPTEANNRGGAVVLPSSTTAFRLDSAVSPNLMTLSTWVYWNGNAGGTIISPAGIAGSMNSSNTAGWSLKIQSNGVLRFAWVQTAGGGRSRDTTSSVITAGQWLNTAIVFDSNISQPVAMYLNGVALSTTGSSGDPLMGIMKADTNDIALGVSYHTSGVGRQSLNGYMDDYAMWDTALTAAKLKSINTAPSLLSGYNAGIMNSLFTAFDTAGSQAVGSLTWNYATGFDSTGKALGDTWLGGDGKYYMWLAGSSGSEQGLLAVPEPTTIWMLLGGGLLLFGVIRRRSHANL